MWIEPESIVLSYKPGTGIQASHDLTHKMNVKSCSHEVGSRMVVTEGWGQ